MVLIYYNFTHQAGSLSGVLNGYRQEPFQSPFPSVPGLAGGQERGPEAGALCSLPGSCFCWITSPHGARRKLCRGSHVTEITQGQTVQEVQVRMEALGLGIGVMDTCDHGYE